MATLQQKISAEHAARSMLENSGVPQPDEVEYGHTCIRLLWLEQKVALIVDIDEPPAGTSQADDEVEDVICRDE